MKSAPFTYIRPETVTEALSVLADYGEDVRILAGGQSLGAMLNMRIVTPAIVLDLNRIAALETIAAPMTGALVRQRDALGHAELRRAVPLLAQALPHVGHYQTRNRGTLGGSVAHADPSAEIPLALATLQGEIELKSKRRTRKVSAAEFFRSALVTAREPDELLTALHWPALLRSARTTFFEFAVREGDFAIVSVACVVDAPSGSLRLGFGGCGDTPQVVVPKGLTTFDRSTIDDIVEQTVRFLDYRSDLTATAAYRMQLAGVLARKAIAEAIGPEVAHA